MPTYAFMYNIVLVYFVKTTAFPLRESTVELYFYKKMLSIIAWFHWTAVQFPAITSTYLYIRSYILIVFIILKLTEWGELRICIKND
jgi:hypothetical protein